MKIAILREQIEGERRVAATPDTVKKYIALGASVSIESNAGSGISVSDSDYEAAGAAISGDISDADIILCVRAPSAQILASAKENVVLVGMLDPYAESEKITIYKQQKISAFSLELLPRISRAQSMDVLSSQSNLAGYRAVIDAVSTLGKAVPMMMTAAGTIAPAKILVLGAGVAGLQAIATAKRLGAVVSAFDVRPVAKEQVESLGAKFIAVAAQESGEGSGGYAKEMSEDYKRKQSELIAETIIKQDIVISTALIPGRPAPILITEEMVKNMKQGSVIVDLAAASGGNCPLTELDKTVVKHGVMLIGYSNMPSRVAIDASQLYARNLYNFISTLLIEKNSINVRWDDELVKGTLLTHNGETVHSMFAKQA
ncbi:MAG: Re/Si-specific NAD(P)(+) transhydrogenase subunit alpha [Rickettsiales bacterium]